MKVFRLLAAASMLALLAGCGGGGSSGGGSTQEQPLVLTVSLSASSQTDETIEGATAKEITYTVTYSANRSFTTPVIAIADYDKAVFSSVTATAGSTANSFTITATTLPNLSGGTIASPITVKLCKDAGCANVYAGATTSFTENMTVNLQEWAQFQRNAAHNGFVHVTLEPTKFTAGWTWTIPTDGNQYNAINAVTTGNGMVYATRDGYFLTGAIYALNENDGSVVWKSNVPNLHSEGSATYDNGTLYVPTQDASEASNIMAFNAKNGTFINKATFYTQWANFISPTAFGGNIYFSGESTLVGLSPITGTSLWQTNIPSSLYGLETPAADEKYIYFSTGASYGGNSKIEILNRADGSLYGEITDPLGAYNGYEYYGAPILGASNSLIAYSGEASTGLALSSSETYASRNLARFDVAAKSLLWHTTNAYITTPAYANGVIYAAQNSPLRFDAISETDGSVLWSWTPPAGDSAFHNNIIVTDNLAFVSTDQNVYAIDLTSHKSVWSYKAAGKLSLSPNYILYISTGIGHSDGGLVAIKLK
jgi:outer membrane protein assembly factor BamB